MLATAGAFERLSPRWNCQVGGGHPCVASAGREQGRRRRLQQRDRVPRAVKRARRARKRELDANATVSSGVATTSL